MRRCQALPWKTKKAIKDRYKRDGTSSTRYYQVLKIVVVRDTLLVLMVLVWIDSREAVSFWGMTSFWAVMRWGGRTTGCEEKSARGGRFEQRVPKRRSLWRLRSWVPEASTSTLSGSWGNHDLTTFLNNIHIKIKKGQSTNVGSFWPHDPRPSFSSFLYYWNRF